METEYELLSLEQSNAAYNFLDALFKDDVNRYWDTISKVDKSRIYGMYRIIKDDYPDMLFGDYVKSIQEDQRKIFEAIKGSYGLTTTKRYTKEGEVLVYALKDIKEPTIITEKTEAIVWDVILVPDTDIVDNEIVVSWKARLYSDTLYNDLNQNY